MKQFLLTIVACISIFFGLLTVWTPIPTGVPLLAFGLFILIATHSWAARLLRRLRRSYAFLNDGMIWVEERTKGQFSRVLRRSRPRVRTVTNPLGPDGGENPSPSP